MDPINNKPALVKIMAYHLNNILSHFLSKASEIIFHWKKIVSFGVTNS